MPLPALPVPEESMLNPDATRHGPGHGHPLSTLSCCTARYRVLVCLLPHQEHPRRGSTRRPTSVTYGLWSLGLCERMDHAPSPLSLAPPNIGPRGSQGMHESDA